MSLITDLNLADHDALYERLIAAHEGLDEAESAAFNARLILILMNHIGDRRVLEEAFELAARAGRPDASPKTGQMRADS
ncbi:hypothetical protein B6V74_04560 [Thioclava sp. F42-5]|uniref:DUF2783 domain-containing protein n=1 Tax=unclassified Thioclava TaxID=2621713 RepID=UPI000B53AC52|nr:MULTISPECIES: DUF2783 domain-containing protein [unclassified Thioclava]OWY11291.1 hypothetical protein B6V74_04560 [Thioclava sp. F42-5]PWE50916.1 DUF2783 domain-containing protein [Thioclava sp. NG1]